MSRTLSLALMAAAVLASAGCTTTRADGSPRIQTTSQANRESVQGAVVSPLRDVNVLRTKIPPILLEAQADPYRRPYPASCESLIAEIRPLSQALGADLDEEAVDEDDLIAFCRDHIAHYKAPKTIVFGTLPKTSTGKIQKFKLQQKKSTISDKVPPMGRFLEKDNCKTHLIFDNNIGGRLLSAQR